MKPHPWLGTVLAAACLAMAARVRAQSPVADSLPAFKPDSLAQDPFRKVEAGPSPWTQVPAAAPQSGKDSAARSDSLASQLGRRRPALSVHLGVDFFDLDAKEDFSASLAALIKDRTEAGDTLKVLQGYDPVHLAFPIGLQAIVPVGSNLDLVLKTHSYWYRQKAILGHADSRHARDGWYAVQANLGGMGVRYYVPPSLLSVTGGLGLFVQGVVFWNLGGTEIYTPYGSAPARRDPLSSAYEIQFGVLQSVSGPWQLAGSIGFLQQDFTSARRWNEILAYAPPEGKVHWGSSAISASMNLWYRFGTGKTAEPLPAGSASAIAPSK